MKDDWSRNLSENWTPVREASAIELDSVVRWDVDGRTYAVFRSENDEVFVTDNICTHEHAYLSDGYFEGTVVECPRHAGRFDVRSGAPLGAPVCVALKTYPTKIEDGMIFADLS
ncbi:non-heme iron oxygenase ferredoxin subunit [Shinella sp.]|uniref:non-heme iron oxygenase ferredoxin subunit n=1 Tax=Shinella sp. TaxID=1870904 RepID=UPI00258F15AA|nr:non-heme iron oxygenase ferredoxin subunit [Shinella sp.]MCW5706870.1 non-heme iron oxygenase ferredoxin subunit [Shinella sp.]